MFVTEFNVVLSLIIPVRTCNALLHDSIEQSNLETEHISFCLIYLAKKGLEFRSLNMNQDVMVNGLDTHKTAEPTSWW